MTAGASQGLNLRSLLEEMIEKDASDLHIVAGERPKLRVDGDIVNAGVDAVLTPKDTLSIAYSVLTENQKKRFETENELDFSFGIQNLARFRGNCFKQRGCVSLVIRQIPFNVRTFKELGLPGVVAKLADTVADTDERLLVDTSVLVGALELDELVNVGADFAGEHA